MATSFPSSLDAFTNPSSADALDSVSVPHATQHSDLNDAVEALQAKVGVDSSAVSSSLDYKVAQITADMNALPGGLLGRADSTSDFTVTTSGVEILSLTFTVDTARFVLLQGLVPLFDLASTTNYVRLGIENATAGSATATFNEAWQQNTTTSYNSVFVQIVTTSFAAGTHTVYLNADCTAGTVRANGAGGHRRHELLAFDVGPQ